jgi:DNA-binding Lrp family transcriptional regulator
MDTTTLASICARSPELIAQSGSHGADCGVRLPNVPEMDATDARLLLALAEDPRASVMALSQRLGLARNTVQARLARLESSGALAPLDRRVRPEALGYRLGAYVTVQVIQRSLADVSDGLAQIPEVLEVTGLSGVADLLVEVVAKDADDLWRITEQVLAIPGVQRTDTALALRRFVDHRLGPLLERAAGGGAAAEEGRPASGG